MTYSKFFPVFLRNIFLPKPPPLLGRWSLKHKCTSEEIVVLNANRDNCGDTLCGDPNDYRKFVDVKK